MSAAPTSTVLVLPEALYGQVQGEGVSAYPNECCGVLIGREQRAPGGDARVRIVERLLAVRNEFEPGEQYHRFLITPDTLRRAEKAAGEEDRLVLGFYHSHPDHPARPSEYDRQHAWPFYSYVIVAIEQGRPGPMTSWVLDERTDEFVAQELAREGAAMSNDYAYPEIVVSTEWVSQHASDPNVKLIEVDVDTSAYDRGHIPGAVGWNWQRDLQDRTVRDVATPEAFAELCRRSGIGVDDTVVLYGDNNNWFAAWALWQFKYHGHKDARLMNGGRRKWELEKRPLTTEPPAVVPSDYPTPSTNETIRAHRDEVMATIGHQAANLIDVRSPDEYTGRIIAPPGMTETAQRAGHIPGARNVPWSLAVNEDGTFKSADDLRRLYREAGLDLQKPTIAYCRIGERSSHTWFVLKYLLGAPNVKNYDGSWTEWGNLVGAPIATGPSPAAADARCQ